MPPPLPDLDTTSPDPGYYGPDSIAWRVHHDPAALVSGITTLMLETLHPDVMRAFDSSTSFTEDPWGRLFRTAGYINTVVYGTRAEADAGAARVRRVHAALGLDRQDWLLWVHCGAVDSWLSGHRRSGAPMTDAEADQFVAEHVRLATLTGIDIASVPTDTSSLAAYFDDVRPTLRTTQEARDGVRWLIWPDMEPRLQYATPARPLWVLAATTAYGLLPRWARKELNVAGLPALPTTDLSASIAARLVRSTLLAIPESRRTSPHVAAARERLALARAA